VLVLDALVEQRFERLVVGRAEEAARAQQAAEGAQRQPLFQPQRRVPRGVAGALAAPRLHQQPVLTVGRQPQARAGGRQQLQQARGGRGPPAVTGDGLLEVLRRRVDHD